MAAIDIVNRVFREFKRYTGDGLPGEPLNAPLPIGDPQSGPHNAKKSELRAALLAPIVGGGEAAQAVIDANLPEIIGAKNDSAASATAANAARIGAEEAAAGAGVTDGDKGDITASSSGTVWSINDESIDFDKLALDVRNRFLTGGFDTIAAAAAANLSSSDYVNVRRYSTAAKQSPAIYARASAEPVHLMKFQDTTGAWFELAPGQIYQDRMFGVMADAVLNQNVDGTFAISTGTDDTAALRRMSDFIRVRPGRYILDGGIRRVWPNAIANGTRLMDIRATRGVTVEYVNGASIHAEHPNPVTDAGTVFGFIWDFTGAQGLVIRNPSLTQEGGATRSDSCGVKHFEHGTNFATYGAASNCEFLNVRQIGGLGGVSIQRPGGTQEIGNMVRQIKHTGYYEKVFYPHTAAGSGDQAKIDLYTKNCGRSIFLYNVHDVEFNLMMEAPFGTSGNVNLTCYNDPEMKRDLKNIRGVIRMVGALLDGTANHSLVSLNAIHSLAGQPGVRMINVDLTLDINGNNSSVLEIHKYDNSGGAPAIDSTTRGHSIIGLDVKGYANAASAFNPYDLFTNNPLGAGESWANENVIACGFRNFYHVGSGNFNFDGRGVRLPGVGGAAWYFKDCYFGPTFVATNAAGKVVASNTNYTAP